MPATQPRISTVVERPLYQAVEALAARDGMSLSQKARDLLSHAVELEEDADLERLVTKRMKNTAPGIPSDKFWAARAARRRTKAAR